MRYILTMNPLNFKRIISITISRFYFCSAFKLLIQMPRLSIRFLQKKDAPIIHQSFKNQEWNKPVSQYEKYFQEQVEGVRTVLIAEIEGVLAGYLTIMWRSNYEPFQAKNIPEIVDFNVFIKFQRQGIGNALMDAAEIQIKQISSTAGIGVGLIKDYGAAQVLYVKRGYVPDGRGIILDNHPLSYGDLVTLGDDPILYFTKEL